MWCEIKNSESKPLIKFLAHLDIGVVSITMKNKDARAALKSEKYKQIINILGLEVDTTWYESLFSKEIDYKTYVKEFSANKKLISLITDFANDTSLKYSKSNLLTKYFNKNNEDKLIQIVNDKDEIDTEFKSCTDKTVKLTGRESDNSLVLTFSGAHIDECVFIRFDKLEDIVSDISNNGFKITIPANSRTGERFAISLVDMLSIKPIESCESELGMSFYKFRSSDTTHVFITCGYEHIQIIKTLSNNNTFSKSYTGMSIFTTSTSLELYKQISDIVDTYKTNAHLFEFVKENQIKNHTPLDNETKLNRIIESIQTKNTISSKEFEELKQLYFAQIVLTNIFGIAQSGVSKTEGVISPLSKSDTIKALNSGNIVYKIENGLIEVDGVDDPESELKDILDELSDITYLSIMNKFNSLGYATSLAKDPLLDRSSLKLFFSRQDDIDDVTKKLPEKTSNIISIAKLIELFKSIDKYSNTYFGVDVKNNSYALRHKSRRLVETVIKNVEDLKDLVFLACTKNKDAYEGSKFSDGVKYKVVANSKIRGIFNDFLKNKDVELSEKQKAIELMLELPSHDHIPFLSDDYEIFNNEFWMTWAMSGGTDSHNLAYYFYNDSGKNNIGKTFWNQDSILTSSNAELTGFNPYIQSHFDKMYESCQAFYKKKLKKKYENATFKLYRGCTGDQIDRYTPGTVESWTSLLSTAKKFADTMASGKIKYVLVTEVPVTALISTYEHLGSTKDFPPDSDLKGKKEFMVLGGALKDAEVRVFTTSADEMWSHKINIFERFINESERGLNYVGKLKVVYADDKGFTDPDTDSSIVDGTKYEKW